VPRKFLLEDIQKRLKSTKITIVGPYYDMNSKTEFKCYCGNHFFCAPKNILGKYTKSCGCFRKESLSNRCLIDLSKKDNKQYGRLTLLKLLPEKGIQRKYLCECLCGKVISVRGCNLKSGQTQSCGCFKNEQVSKNMKNKIGYKNSSYNPNLTEQDRIDRRNLPELRQWRVLVFKRDNYTCQICGNRSCNLNAHHLDGWHWCKERRFDLSNGVTLCSKCHKDYHSKYGRKNNTEQQFIEFKKLEIIKVMVKVS